MLQKVALGADKVIFTRASDTPRAVDPRDLLRKFSESSPKMAQTAVDLKTALNTAARAVSRDDLICVTGSFYLAGEAKRLLLEKRSRVDGEAGAAAAVSSPAVVNGRIVEPAPVAKKTKTRR
jgi:dihydrofolate synthase/folylpolyglutamate synthase